MALGVARGAMQVALADMRGPIKAIINDMQDQADAQFASLGAAAQTPWAPLSLDTIRNKMAAGYPAPPRCRKPGDLPNDALGDFQVLRLMADAPDDVRERAQAAIILIKGGTAGELPATVKTALGTTHPRRSSPARLRPPSSRGH